MLKVTTSWDDGDVLDERIADLMEKYALKGTFYIPRDYWGKRLDENQIKRLSTRHEIGAHTLSHSELTKIPMDQVRAELVGSKEWLEKVTGKTIRMFCYPRGRYNSDIRDAVQAVGYIGARTTKLFSLQSGEPFEMETSMQVYVLPLRRGAGIRRIFEPLQQRFFGLRSLGVPVLAMHSFESATKAAFDEALKRGGVFHLWGHSWEIEKQELWTQLEEVFRHISKSENCEYVTNGELI